MTMPARKPGKPLPKAPVKPPKKGLRGVSGTTGRAAHDHATHDHAADHGHDHPDITGAAIGQRNTRPRAAIIAILAKALGPLTVPEIHAQAQDEDTGAKIGIATVYRTLNLLVENKMAQAVMLPTGETRYEAAGHKGHHDHFQCVNCTRVYDIDTCLLGLPSGVVIPGGYRVQGHELTLTGLCPACDKPAGSKPSRHS